MTNCNQLPYLWDPTLQHPPQRGPRNHDSSNDRSAVAQGHHRVPRGRLKGDGERLVGKTSESSDKNKTTTTTTTTVFCYIYINTFTVSKTVSHLFALDKYG